MIHNSCYEFFMSNFLFLSATIRDIFSFSVINNLFSVSFFLFDLSPNIKCDYDVRDGKDKAAADVAHL